MMCGYFVSGTDTDVGKSVVTAALLRALLLRGTPVRAVKAVQSGVLCAATQGDAALYTDAALHTEAAGQGSHVLEARTLRTFRLAASPHLAAREEGQEVAVDSLVDDIRALAQSPPALLLVEGAGGLRVPLNDHADMLDLMCRLDLPVILVAANRLGVLNHVLLSVDAAQARGLRVAAVVLTRTQPTAHDRTAQAIIADSAPCLRARLPHIPLLEVPYCAMLKSADAATRAKGWNILAQALENLAQQVRQTWEREAASGPPDSAAQARLSFDAAHLWHPYTSLTRPLRAREVTRTAGNRIHVRGAGWLVDGMASWWCAIHGYGHPHLVQAAQRQAGKMSHVMFGGLTHEPAVTLGQSLLPLLPKGLEQLFFADSGSVAVEVALKMALQYARTSQESRGALARDVFIVPRGGYHGDTVGAMSVCDPVNGMHTLFDGFLPRQIFVERPSCPFGAYNSALQHQSSAVAFQDVPFDPRSTQALEAAFAAHGHRAAACILEPVVQGAGGMWLYHPEYLRRVAALCRHYGVLLIVDEIATGFGRTGKLFACEWAGIEPDILCLGKALTGGMLTMAATACSARVAQGICATGGVFMHGPTFMANPLACAVAQASLELLLASPWQERVASIEAHLIESLAPCAALPGVAQVRILGGIGVVECAQPVPVEKLQHFFVQQGVWLRPFGRLIYCMPPYTIHPQELEQVTRALRGALEEGIHCL